MWRRSHRFGFECLNPDAYRGGARHGDRPLVELALCDKFTRSLLRQGYGGHATLVESRDYIVAFQNENQNGAKYMKGTGKDRRSHAES